MKYHISRRKKLGIDWRKLSISKKRWLTVNSKHKFCLMTDDEADKFIAARRGDENYYYFKTLT